MGVWKFRMTLRHEIVEVFFLLIVPFLLDRSHIVIHLHDSIMLFLNLYIVQIVHEVVIGCDVCPFAGQALGSLLLVVVLVFFDLGRVLVH